ncbi:MAG: hypothetical protein AB7V62_09965 [Thermoleophilia bacterium]
MTGEAGRLCVRSTPLGRPVLERLVAALAARVDLPVDRLADAQLVASAVAASAPRHTADGTLLVGLDAEGAEVGLAVGPLREGSGEQVINDSRLPGVGTVLERLVDGWTVVNEGAGETLQLTIGAGT